MSQSKLNSILLLLFGCSVAATASEAGRQARSAKNEIGAVCAGAQADKFAAAKVKSDFYGDSLPPGAVARMGSIRLWHSAAVKHLAFLTNGKLASAATDGTVRVWESDTGKELSRFQVEAPWIYGFAVSPDRNFLAASSDAIYVWDATTGKKLHELHKFLPPGTAYSLAFTSDCKRLVSGHGDDTYRVWDMESGKLLMTFTAGKTFFPKIAISPNGRIIATTGGNQNANCTIHFWDLLTGGQVLKPIECAKRIDSLAFSPDGRSVVAGQDDGKIFIWEVSTGQLRHNLDGHKRQAISLTFSPDGSKLVSAGGDYSVRIWEYLSGKEIRRIQLAHVEMNESVWTVACSPDGRTLATGSNSHRIQLWDELTGSNKHQPEYIQGPAATLCFTPDGKRLITGSGSVIAWDAATGKYERTYSESAGKQIYSLSMFPDGQMLAAGTSSSALVWKTDTGEEVMQAEGISFRTALLPQARLVTTDHFRSKVWDLTTHKPIYEVQETMLAASLTGQIARRHGFDLFLYDANSKQDRMKLALPVPSNPPKIDHPKDQVLENQIWIECAAFASDGKTLATASRAVLTNNGHAHGRIAHTYQENVHLWSVGTGNLVQTFSLPVEETLRNGIVTCLAFSPDGHILAAGGKTVGDQKIPPAAVYFWDVQSGKQVHQKAIPRFGNERVVSCLAFSPDGKMLATGGCDATVLIWELPPSITTRGK